MNTETARHKILAILAASPALLLLFTLNGLAEDNLAAKATFHPGRSLDVEPYSVANLSDGEITVNKDPRSCESCWCGGRVDLSYQPLDVVVDLGTPRVIDRIVVTTCRLKNQQRLTDFDVYGWAGSDWDGHSPLAQVRDSTDLRMELRFQAVSVPKICIRLLDNVRPNHDFPHISEVEVYTAAGSAVRKLTPGGLPKPLGELTTLGQLEAEAANLKHKRENGDAGFSGRRLELVENKLAFQRETLPWKVRLDEVEQNTERLIDQGIPRWAAAQSEALSKYVLWIHWWLDHAQPNGEFGGSLNDDVELVCGWPLACLAADDRATFDALALLGETVWEWGPVKDFGYSRYTDVEHSSEEISYSQPRMVLLDYADPKWAQRCALTTRTCLREFMGENGRGNLQFRSDFFGYKNGKPLIDADRPFDIPEGAKALKPTLYAAWSGNEEAKRTVLRYGDTWLDAAMQEYEGKPRGLLPAKIDFETGKPEGMALRMPPMRATHYHLIGCYLLSGDPKYLAPAEHTIRYFLVENNRGDLPLMRSGDIEHMGLSDQLAIIASLWRTFSKNESLDPHFERWSRRLAGAMGPRYESYAMVDSAKKELWVKEPLPVGAYLMGRRAIGSQFYIGWLASGDKDLLECGCRNLGNNLSDMWGPLTWWFYDKTESRVTSNDHSAHSIQTAASMLMMMYTGGCGPIEAKYPYTPVRWEGTTVNFAALVLKSDRSHVKLLAANLEPEERQVTMRLGELAPGEYLVTRGPDADGDDVADSIAESKTVTITRHAPVELTLPSLEMQVVAIEKP